LERERVIKDKTILNQLKDADAQTKNGDYRGALAVYNRIYASTSSFAAGYNAAIVTELLGDLPGAITLMRRLAAETGNPRASSEAARLQQYLAERTELEENYTGGNLVDRVIRQVSDSLLSQLSGKRVSLLNIASGASRQFTEQVVDGISIRFMGTMTLVDRQNSAILRAEQLFQASGRVDDASAVSLGHELGVEVIILCSVSGTGSSRRLAVRAVSVETSEIVYQTSQEI
jgi:hypothetical protein